jgi:heat-inducible transcriptional repressor
MVENVLQTGEKERVFIGGTTNILIQPEFKDVDKVKNILDLLAETPTLIRLVSAQADGIQVRIGAENTEQAMTDCSLITASYSIDGKPLGTVGILGPTRMEYGKVIRLLDYMSKNLEVMMGRWFKT